MEISLSQEAAISVLGLLHIYSKSVFETIKQNNLLAFCAIVMCQPFSQVGLRI